MGVLRTKIKLPIVLLVGRDVLGTTHSTAIGDEPVDITFPQEGHQDVRILDPGGRLGLDSCRVAAVTATWTRRVSDHPPDEQELRTLDTAVKAWAENLNRWLGAITEFPQGRDSDDLTCLELVDDHGNSRRRAPQRYTLIGIAEKPSPSLTAVQAAMHLLARQEEPPIERLLLIEASAFIGNHEHRVAVISACGAVEISLQTASRERLAALNVPQPFIDLTLKQSQGLSRLWDLYASLSAATPADTDSIKRLGRLRNQAVHRGHTPTKGEANDALTTAWTVVRHLSPFPS